MMRFPKLLALFLVLARMLPAQQPVTPPVPVTRLQQMEDIYQKELSSRHIPLLGKYLIELQRQAAMTADKEPYHAEIGRVQQIISAGGVVDLIAAQQAQAGAVPMPPPPVSPVPPERKQALIALSPALAKSLSPTTPPDSLTAVLGEADWRIELLAAGTYDVLAHYACPGMTETLPLRIEFAGQTLEKDLELDRSTKDAQTFRIFRVGTLTLTADQRGETIHFVAGDKSSPKFILKSLLITRPRPPAN